MPFVTVPNYRFRTRRYYGPLVYVTAVGTLKPPCARLPTHGACRPLTSPSKYDKQVGPESVPIVNAVKSYFFIFILGIFAIILK